MSFDYAARELIAQKGELVLEDPSIFMWAEWDWRSHKYKKEKCPFIIPETGPIYNTTRARFDGTFVDLANVEGLEITGVNCACGKYTNRTFRWEGSFSELLQELLNIEVINKYEY